MKRPLAVLATLRQVIAVSLLLSFSPLSAQTNFVKYTGNPILPLGNPGEWDDAGAAYAHVSFDGTTHHLWYSGSPQVFTYRIGYASSPDGVNWNKHANNPILSPSSGFDNVDTWLPMVLFDGSAYKMWYTGSSSVGAIGYATAADPVSWTKHTGNPVIAPGGGAWDQNAALVPIVIRTDTLYHMWYSGLSANSRFQSGYATSTDGLSWSKHSGNPVLPVGAPGEWDAVAAIAGSVIFADGQFQMWYHGTTGDPYSNWKIGYATSPDGVNWTKHSGNPILQPGGGWDAEVAGFPRVIKDGHRYRMWYTGRRLDSAERLGHAEDFSNAAHVDSIRVSANTVAASDTIFFAAYIANPHSENLTAQALIKSNDGGVNELVDLTNAGNGVWQGEWVVPADAHDYSVGVELNNLSAGYVHNSFDWGVFDEFRASLPIISPVPDSAQVELLTSNILFGEGPLWHPDGFLLCTDLDANQILRIDPETGAKEVYLSQSEGANGLAFDTQQNLIMCRGNGRNVARLESDGTVTVIASHYNGKRLNSPNDLVVRSDGTIFFTDPHHDNSPPPQELPDGIYAIDKNGELKLLDTSVSGPNGICLSPDEKNLYVNDARSGVIHVFDVVNDSTLANKSVFAQITGAVFVDGMKVDENGLLFSAAGNNGVWIFSPDGEFIDRIDVPGLVTNINWGDSDYRTLYITELNSVYKIRLNTKGLVTDVAYEYVQVPARFELFQNYPNPFNPTTIINYNLPNAGHVQLKIYNTLGQEIRTLVNSIQPVGTHEVIWDGRDNSGNIVPSGVYFYQLRAGTVVETRKMLLLQ